MRSSSLTVNLFPSTNINKSMSLSGRASPRASLPYRMVLQFADVSYSLLFYLRTKLSKITEKSRNRVTYSRIVFQYVKERFVFAILSFREGIAELILLSSPWGIRWLSFRHVPYCHPCVLPVFRQSSLWTSLSLSHRADRRIRTYHPLPLPVVSLSIHWTHWDPLPGRPHEESARETPESAWGRCAYRLFLLLEA